MIGDPIAMAGTPRKRSRRGPLPLLLLAGLLLVAMAAGGRAAERMPDKFIPTAALKYGKPQGEPISAAEMAKFDLLMISDGREALWAEGGRNSWQVLKGHNPDMVILVYATGPGAFNTASWGGFGNWEWILANHGPDKPLSERWVCRGARSGQAVGLGAYGHTRFMHLGNPDWVEYYWQQIYQSWWATGKNKGADGVFADSFHFTPLAKGVGVVADTQTPERPSEYFVGDALDNEKWQRHYREAVKRIAEGFASKPERPLFVPNFGYMHLHPEWWAELDNLPHPPFAAMEEAGIVQRYGGGLRSFEWDTKVGTISRMKNTAVIVCCHGDGLAGEGLARMDSVDTKGNMGPGTTGWDGLWFAMTSFLMALNEQKTNGYLLFTVWHYQDPHWFDEFDPAFIHLGKPLGGYTVRDGVAFREYEDGWVVANKTYENNRTGIPVPGGGQARVINHASFKDPERAPLVSTFDLPYYRGVILLKPGKKLGNQDNRRP